MFEPKKKEDILNDIARKRTKNRAMIIGMYEKHPEKFDEFFDMYLKIINFDFLWAFIKLKTSSYVLFSVDPQECIRIKKMFSFLGFNTDSFNIWSDGFSYKLHINLPLEDTAILNDYLQLCSDYAVSKKDRKTKVKKRPGF